MIEKISGTVVLGTVCPNLEELKTRPCSPQELQAALVQLIEVVNRNAERIVQRQDKHDIMKGEFNV